MQNIDSDLIRGNIDTIILKTMLNEDKYGLDIIKEVSDKSSGTYVLKQPTLYSCLKRLENQELISSYWVDSDIGGKRHYYKLTDKGREFYNKKQEEWAKSKFIIDNLLSNYNYEEYRLVKKDEYDEILQSKANAPLPTQNQELSAEDNNSVAEISKGDEMLQDEEVQDIQIENHATNTEIEDDKDEDEDEFDVNTEDYYTSDESQEIDFDTNESNICLDEESFDLGTDEEPVMEETDFEDETNINEDDYPVYFSAKQYENSIVDKENSVSYETPDQSSNELNILSRLRNQEDETINTYYGDQKSYVNHLNQLDESQLEQQDLLDNSLYVRPDEVNKMIDAFSTAIENLNGFNNNANDETEDLALEEETNDSDDFEDESDSFIEESPAYELSSAHEEPDDLDELHNLKKLSTNTYFDNHYPSDYYKEKTYFQEQNSYEGDSSDYEIEEESSNLSSMSFAEISNEIAPETNEQYTEFKQTELVDYSSHDTQTETSHNNMSDIDAIISNNITTNYAEPNFTFYKTQSSNNYRDKLSCLSKYSRVNLEDDKPEVINEKGLEKAKDISEIMKELEDEGIKVKEHYKQMSDKKFDKNYLLSNKINFIKSLIMFFGYVFILSGTYIILNNTEIKNNSWFSLTPFLIGFIPFAVIMLYNGILFMINPYKKVDSVFHFRIMFFISVIITIQLLLITYCLNLQLGFYSFTQQGYNHLYWIVPGLICFAPIIDNLIYLALFNSRNFNV